MPFIVILFISFYISYKGLILVKGFSESLEIELVLNVAGGIFLLVGPLFIAAVINSKIKEWIIKREIIKWCQKEGVQFSKIHFFKNHDAVTYISNGEKVYKKFIVKLNMLTYKPINVDWK